MYKFTTQVLKKIIFICCCIVLSSFTFAEDSQFNSQNVSNVELEWEEIPEALKYDLEIKSKSKTYSFFTQKPMWFGRLIPGLYKMRIRARDKRNSPGVWTEYQDIKVYLDSVKIKNLQEGSTINASNEEFYLLKLEWSNIKLADFYRVYVENISTQKILSFETKENQIEIKLPVAFSYKLKIRAFNNELESNEEKENIYSFKLEGPKLEDPIPKILSSLYVRDLSWTKPKFTEKFSVSIDHFDNESKQFVEKFNSNNQVEPYFKFPSYWIGGLYRLKVKALADNRISSDIVEYKFNVKNGDRTRAAEELEQLRDSIDRLSGLYLTATYLVTSVNYENLNYDTSNPSRLKFDAIGATARVGLGSMKKNKPWGYFLASELSQIQVKGFGNVRYKSFDLSSTYRNRYSLFTDFRHHLGLSYKELPALTLDFSSSESSQKLISAAGIRYGFEFWYALTSKIGLQTHFQINSSFVGLSTPNGQKLKPTFSNQLGLLGSYRLNKNLTALLGYSFRQDELKFENSNSSATGISRSEFNQTQVQGHYLNFMLEYQL